MNIVMGHKPPVWHSSFTLEIDDDKVEMKRKKGLEGRN